MGIGKHSRLSSGKANKPKKGRSYKEISWHQCQCSSSSQIPSQDDANFHQFLSLYKFRERKHKAELVIYDTENEQEKVKIFDNIRLNCQTVITQLPNGELFCNSFYVAFIIDKSYRVRILPWPRLLVFSALYFDNNIYCSGRPEFGSSDGALFCKFDLQNNRWIDLILPPKYDDTYANSVIFNGNILVSGYYTKKLLLYSIEIDSFSIIPYEFETYTRKVLINVERLYLIEWSHNEWIYYESEDEYHWMQISKSKELHKNNDPMYCLYNKGKIYISNEQFYYQFDLKTKFVSKINIKT